mmetsp:Transcript_45613/g.128804  ORF Transcript_45613/g.128804 Transcript_45613/m.128804 type:complete len:179 (+) Transcript_45613:267-803(+)
MLEECDRNLVAEIRYTSDVTGRTHRVFVPEARLASQSLSLGALLMPMCAGHVRECITMYDEDFIQPLLTGKVGKQEDGINMKTPDKFRAYAQDCMIAALCGSGGVTLHHGVTADECLTALTNAMQHDQVGQVGLAMPTSRDGWDLPAVPEHAHKVLSTLQQMSAFESMSAATNMQPRI